MKPWEKYKGEEVPQASSNQKPWERYSSSIEPVSTPGPVTETPITLDLTPSDNIVTEEVPGTVQSVDTSTTEPTKLMSGLSTVEAPVYMNDAEAKVIQEKSYEQAAKAGIPYIDPITGEDKGIPLEPGLEETLAVLDIVGGLQTKGLKNVGSIYDNITEALIEVGKSEPKLSKGAKYMRDLESGIITPDKFMDNIKHIPKEEQAILLAESDELFKNYFKGAVDKSDKTASKLAARFKMRKDVIAQFSANKKQMKEASEKFGEMRKTIAEQVPDTVVTSSIKKDIQDLEKVYASDPTPIGTTIRNISNDVGGEMDIDTALDIIENVNAVLRKPKISKRAQSNLKNIKNSVNSFIDTALKDRPDLIKLRNDSVNEYRQVINDYQLGQLIKKNTTNRFAVNWENLSKDIKKNKLSSDNIDYAKPILKDFERRFINDKALAKFLPSSGSGSSNLLSVLSNIYTGIIDIGHKILRTDRAHGLTIENEIRKSINNPKNVHYEDFINSLMRNPKLPNEIKDEVRRLSLPYNPISKNTGDINLTPMFASKEGTIGRDVSQVALHDAQRQLVRDSLGKEYSDEVINKTSEMLSSKRFTDVMKSTADRMKADDISGNMKMLQKTLKSEVDQIVNRINKDHGVKLPSSEVEKIYKLKLKEMLKDC